jgi:hypothetical protein
MGKGRGEDRRGRKMKWVRGRKSYSPPPTLPFPSRVAGLTPLPHPLQNDRIRREGRKYFSGQEGHL